MRKITFTKVLAILGVALLFVSSCTEAEEIIVEAEKAQPITVSEIENPKNPFEDDGIKYIKTVEFLGEKYGSELRNTPIKELKEAVSDYAVSQGSDKLDEEDFRVVNQILACSKDGDVTGGCIKDPFCIFFPKKCAFLEDLIESFEQTTIASKEESLEFTNQIIGMEDDMGYEKSDTNRNNGMRCMSIARYATYDWHNENQELEGSVWYGDIQRAKDIQWKDIVLAGAIGSLDGPYSAGLASVLTLTNQK